MVKHGDVVSKGSGLETLSCLIMFVCLFACFELDFGYLICLVILVSNSAAFLNPEWVSVGYSASWVFQAFNVPVES